MTDNVLVRIFFGVLEWIVGHTKIWYGWLPVMLWIVLAMMPIGLPGMLWALWDDINEDIKEGTA